MVPKLRRELPLIELMMPPKGILMIHSYGRAGDHFVYKGISGGPTQLVVINSCGAERLCSVVTLTTLGDRAQSKIGECSDIKLRLLYVTTSPVF